MPIRRFAPLAACIAAAACSSGHSSASQAPASQAPASQPAPPAARNLVASAAIKAQLLRAGAALHHLPDSDYTGLVTGETYYAYDGAGRTYWAGAGLVPRKGAYRAEVANQDDGAYLDFERPAGGTWRAYPAGLPGSTNYRCAVVIPKSVLALWGWPAGTCHPPA